MGPLLAALGVGSYLTGALLTYLDKGYLAGYPLHLLTGSGIALLIITTFIIARQIKGLESPWRTVHFAIGLLILFLYPFQIYIGWDILF